MGEGLVGHELLVTGAKGGEGASHGVGGRIGRTCDDRRGGNDRFGLWGSEGREGRRVKAEQRQGRGGGHGLHRDLGQRRQANRLRVRGEAHQPGLAGGGSGADPRTQKGRIDRDASREQGGGGIEGGFDGGPLAVEGDDDGLAVAEDLADPPGAAALGTVLHEDTDSVGVSSLDDRAEVEGAVRLGEDRLGARFAAGDIAASMADSVDAHGLLGHLSAVQLQPLLGHRRQLRHVHDEVVAQAQAARAADAVADPSTGGGVASDDAVVVCVDDRHVGAGLVGDGSLHLGQRREHRPGLPMIRTPGVPQDVEASTDALGEEASFVGLADHGVGITPNAGCEEAVALARAVADDRIGAQAQDLAGQPIVQPAHG